MTATTRDPDATRTKLLEAAFEEIFEHGFQAASLDRILSRTGVTKGALYHHFANKRELGYAVVDEVIRPWMQREWLVPLSSAEDPIAALKALARDKPADYGAEACSRGCPINNLAQEMSPLDEGFRQRIQGLLQAWRQAISQALRHGQVAGTVDADVDADKAATFLLASLEGTVGLAKNSQSKTVFEDSRYGFERFLDGLRPARALAG